MLIVMLTLVACGGDEESPAADEPESTVPTETPTDGPTPTVDTSIELPPEITLDPLSRQNATIEILPGTGTVVRSPTVEIIGEATLPPAVIEPTDTIAPAPTRRPTNTPAPVSPTPTELVAIGSCDGFAADAVQNSTFETVNRGEGFSVFWLPPTDAVNTSYDVRIFNSNAGQIYQVSTTDTQVAVPGSVTDRDADNFIIWQVTVLSNTRDLGCLPVDGEIVLTN